MPRTGVSRRKVAQLRNQKLCIWHPMQYAVDGSVEAYVAGPDNARASAEARSAEAGLAAAGRQDEARRLLAELTAVADQQNWASVSAIAAGLTAQALQAL